MSCRRITGNLIDAYKEALGAQMDVLDYPWDISPAQIWDLAGEIHARRPAGLIFVDHLPHPALLAQGLATRFPGRFPRTVAHVYGDFTLYSDSWRRFGDLLTGSELTLVCASNRQIALVSNFLKPSEPSIKRCPFPVRGQDFAFSPELRRERRQAIGAAPGELVILYTGRISMQKNVLRLLREVARFAAARSRVHLVVAGDFDDLGAAPFGSRPEPGEYFQAWRALCESPEIPRSLQIHAPGFQGTPELRAWYSAADVFASLSLHHDEDYGMSPAEAAVSGLPLLLTDWGGYADFSGHAHSCELVTVRLLPEGLQIDGQAIQEVLARVSAQVPTDAKRTEAGRQASERISVSAASRTLAAITRTPAFPFRGFQARLSGVQTGPGSGTDYEEVYRAYVR
jgi:glycosyltransferase involved in cell wall biosynthesis